MATFETRANPQQLAAITTTEGPLLIIAGPGSGKTFTLVAEIARTPGIQDLAMTTNGLLLDKLAGPLAAAGLKRVNISIDTINGERFRTLTRWGNIDDVWRSIRAAEEAGLRPIKLNTVVVRGFNETIWADSSVALCSYQSTVPSCR